MVQELYLRCEMKKAEHRAALTPTTAKKLIEAGFKITVERDPQRIFQDEEYQQAGCTLAPHNSWPSLPSTIPIIGLKELPSPGPDLPNTHIQFAHCYKQQAGWVDVLSRFKKGGGKLYDLEFLEDKSGRRVAAFGWHAGFAGAALGLLALAEQSKDEKKRLGPQTRYPNEKELIDHAKKEIEFIKKNRKDGKVKALVVGALGRCGRGAIDFFQKAGVQDEDIVKWDMAETGAKPGPYQEMLDVDIFVNCIYLNKPIPPFLNAEFINKAGSQRRLGCVVDVSCDTTNPNNPLPIYDINTTFDEPTVDVKLDSSSSSNPLTVISIDHLPTLLPREASEGFSNDLLPSLLQLPYVIGDKQGESDAGTEGKGAVWKRAEDLFRKHLAEAEKEGA